MFFNLKYTLLYKCSDDLDVQCFATHEAIVQNLKTI